MMSNQPQNNKPNRSVSLARTLGTAFVILIALSLLLVSIFQIVLDFQTQQTAIAGQQKIIASDAANEVVSFIDQIFRTMESTAQVGRTFIDSPEDTEILLQSLLGLQPAIREVALLNGEGQEVAKQSRLTVTSELELQNWAGSALFDQVSQNQRYIGPVRIDEITSEPLTTVAVPVADPLGVIQGAVLAEVNLKFMWDLVDSLQIGQEGLAYVVDRQGDLIAFGDTSRVLRGENVSQLNPVANFVSGIDPQGGAASNVFRGINDVLVAGTYVPLGVPNWAIVAETPMAEVYRQVFITIGLSVLVLLAGVVVAGLISLLVARRLTAPLSNLTDTASRISEGELGLASAVEGPTEVRRLAGAFNSMTTQLQDLIGSLEERVADRTRRLEVVASLAERLNAILDFNQLLEELVNQVQENFGYYHVHVYMLDEDSQNLLVAAGTGRAGQEMKASGHSIPLNAATSLVARAARGGEVVRVDNVREAPDWLPNPLLPNTYAEMAVPILLEGRVAGVLDVQADEVGGLDEGDTALLRSLANQVAVAIRNARQYGAVEAALAEAQAVQEQYMQGVWSKVSQAQQGAKYQYRRPGVSQLDEALATRLERAGMVQQEPVIIAARGPEEAITTDEEQPAEANKDETTAAAPPTADEPPTVVAPIRLQNTAIGAIQLHETERQRQWTDQEIALVRAIADQVAQTAENLRLFDETRQRAEYERLVGEITQKIRQAPNFNVLVRTASEEIGQVLGVSSGRVTLKMAEPQTTAETNGLDAPQA